MGFIKSFFASCLGAMVAMVVVVFLATWIFSVVVSSDSTVTVDDHSVLYLDLDVPIVEQAVDDPLSDLIPGGRQAIGLLQLKESIAHAKTNTNIEGIYLNFGTLSAGIATLAEIRESLLDFRESGKWVIAYAPNYSEGSYFLASAADKVYLNPAGQVEFNGLSVEVMFYKRLFEKLEIKPQIFRVGDFKSAVEPFFRENLSEENRLQLNAIIFGIYNAMLDNIAEARNIPKPQLAEISNKMSIRTASDAVTYGLVDSLYYNDQVRNEMRARLGLGEDEDIKMVGYKAYRKSYESPTSVNEIAVIVADGEIMPGKSESGIIGSETMIKEIRKARTNPRVKAIVLRVNSPGGVYQAGDEMWRELVLAAESKPLIASMSDYAASGGYYLAMACDTIVAQPVTITGSIGVFSVLFDLSQFLGNKIGVTTEAVKTGEVGELITVTRPLTDLEKSIWQSQTDEVYEIFTGKAATGRGMTQEAIKQVASGRVWTGDQAKGNGLVDLLGGFNDAVRLAADKGGVGNDYRLRYYPQPKSFLEQLTSNWEEQAMKSFFGNEASEPHLLLKKWEKLRRYEGSQTRMPFELEIR